MARTWAKAGARAIARARDTNRVRARARAMNRVRPRARARLQGMIAKGVGPAPRWDVIQGHGQAIGSDRRRVQSQGQSEG